MSIDTYMAVQPFAPFRFNKSVCRKVVGAGVDTGAGNDVLFAKLVAAG